MYTSHTWCELETVVVSKTWFYLIIEENFVLLNINDFTIAVFTDIKRMLIK